jgi:CDP-4-dehydro-6-deoxyglucose reductase
MFEVKLSNGLKSFAVAKDEAILTAALRAGVNLSHLCRRGTCGACRATVANGEVKQDIFRPAALPHRDREAGHVLLCCSRALSNIVIDATEVAHATEPSRRIPARVVSIDHPTAEVAVVTVRAPLSEPFDYVPGQYIGIVGRTALLVPSRSRMRLDATEPSNCTSDAFRAGSSQIMSIGV